MAMTVGVSEANPNAKRVSYLMLGAAKLTPTCARYRLHWLSLSSFHEFEGKLQGSWPKNRPGRRFAVSENPGAAWIALVLRWGTGAFHRFRAGAFPPPL
jgi:hypothetical protein